MIRQIWRYELANVECDLLLSKGAKVVHVGWSRNGIQLWAEIDTDESVMVLRKFRVVASGEPIPLFAGHVGSLVAGDGFHVFHIYEVAS